MNFVKIGIGVAVAAIILGIIFVGIKEPKNDSIISQGSVQQSLEPTQTTSQKCDPSYPDVCIPTYPPDLDCNQISYSNFRVLQPDRHGFDADLDGIGCEK